MQLFSNGIVLKRLMSHEMQDMTHLDLSNDKMLNGFDSRSSMALYDTRLLTTMTIEMCTQPGRVMVQQLICWLMGGWYIDDDNNRDMKLTNQINFANNKLLITKLSQSGENE
jgi:hypothetical protein